MPDFAVPDFESSRVAVVVPLSLRADVTADEEISLRHLRRHLGRYDKYLIAPTSLKIRWDGFTTIDTGDRYFGSAQNHARLILSPGFYDQFSQYQYILTYHLDALVFSDQLLEWCNLNYDYIGAPLRDDSGNLTRVGNGGFALRRVAAFQRLLRSKRPFVDDPMAHWRTQYSGADALTRSLRYLSSTAKRLGVANDLRYELSLSYRGNTFCEDLFLVDRARHYDPTFNIAPLEQAVRFAFDEFPRRCYEWNSHQLPFGCHAWSKYGRDFWAPFLMTGNNGIGG